MLLYLINYVNIIRNYYIMIDISLSEILQKYNQEIELQHPIYGKYKANKLYNVIYLNLKTKEFIHLNNYQLFITNNKDEPYYLYSKIAKKLLVVNSGNQYCLTFNKEDQQKYGKIRKMFYANNMLLPSIFYDIISKDTQLLNIDELETDHIDEDKYNNLINNLQLISSYENQRKGQQKSVKKVKEKGGKNGTKIMLTYFGNDLKEFQSIGALATYMIDKKLCISNESSNKLISKYFREIISDKYTRKNYNDNKYSAYEIKTEINNEIWIDIPTQLYETMLKNKKYKISNFGRIKNLYGDLMNPTLSRYKVKYSYIKLNKKCYTVHCLVYMSFNPESIDDIINKRVDVCHKDTAPLLKLNDSQLYHRNYLEDLYIDSHSNNIKDYHKNKHIINEIINITKDELYEDENITTAVF